jgi:hypothetical protein
MMKVLLLFFLILSAHADDETGVTGSVISPKGCGDKVMVWLSLDSDIYKERLLLMHTEVPSKGSFQFFLKPGDYQLRASDEKGCEFFKRITVGTKVFHHMVRMVKK